MSCRARFPGLVEVGQEGTEDDGAPGEVIEPHVVEAMARHGLSLADEIPKPLTDDVIRAADVLIAMGCGDSCPIYPGKRYLDWASLTQRARVWKRRSRSQPRSTFACVSCSTS